MELEDITTLATRAMESVLAFVRAVRDYPILAKGIDDGIYSRN